MVRTQVAIVGAGPSGLLLAQLLQRSGVDCIVLERRSREHVAGRIRAGILEPATVALLEQAGVGGRLLRERLVHDGFLLAFEGRCTRIDLKALAKSTVSVYGQTEITRDLIDARLAAPGSLLFDVADVALDGLGGPATVLHYTRAGRREQISCDFIAGCDGYHGVCRRSIPKGAIQSYERSLPFGWLGVLADVPPAANELIYARHERGFALCSMRSATRSRYYLQCPAEERIEDWPDERFWDELRRRLPHEAAAAVTAGPTLDKSIAPLRSFVAEPMRFGRLFLVGDAAHIVPPTGAKGLNLAAADVRVLHQALAHYYGGGGEALLEGYSERCLRRVWRALRFSWWFTSVTHALSDDEFAQKLQLAELRNLALSSAARSSVAESYVGLPLEEP
jgi:p-hydroxybenzoate 3-monooxygenase